MLSVSVQSHHGSGAQTSAPGWWCGGKWLCLPHTDPNLACPMAELVWSGSCCLPGSCRLSSCVVPEPCMSVCEGQDAQAWGRGCGQSCSLACVCRAVAWPVRLCLPPALCPPSKPRLPTSTWASSRVSCDLLGTGVPVLPSLAGAAWQSADTRRMSTTVPPGAAVSERVLTWASCEPCSPCPLTFGHLPFRLRQCWD